MYETEQSLKVHLYKDTNWSKFQKELLCTDKRKHAEQTLNVEFHYHEHEDKKWIANFGMALDQQEEARTHYWYIVLDDCSLESVFRDTRIPTLHYKLQLWNDVGGKKMIHPEGDWGKGEAEKNVQLTHLSADEVGLSTIHAATLVVSVLIATLMGMYIAKLLIQSGTVHASLLLVMLAAGCDALSAIAELIHLKAYEADGVGYYTLDACSSHFEAMCDSVVALLLLSIASGWTLPSDAIVVPQGRTFLQSLVGSMRNPAGALVSLSPAGYLTVMIIASHVFLAQWGRTYDDDFDAYHALEHLPGRLLMLFRMVLGVLLIAATAQTRNSCPPPLQLFYTKLAVVGTCWFVSLPLVTWTCSWAVPYYLRQPTVAIWGAMAQSTALVLLAWLFTAHSGASSFHKVSRLQANTTGDSLTDSLATGTSAQGASNKAAPKSWTFGKTKIRLD